MVPTWATADELAWADRVGVNLSAAVKAAHADGVRVAATLAQQTRDRRLRRIDRALAARDDNLGRLFQAGQQAAERTRRERECHRLTAERYRDAGHPWVRWRAVCACGEWHGEGSPSREHAEQDARRERDRLFQALTAVAVHTPMPDKGRQAVA